MPEQNDDESVQFQRRNLEQTKHDFAFFPTRYVFVCFAFRRVQSVDDTLVLVPLQFPKERVDFFVTESRPCTFEFLPGICEPCHGSKKIGNSRVVAIRYV